MTTIEKLEQEIKLMQESMFKFSQRFEVDPCYALENASYIFDHAAILRVAQQVHSMLEYDPENGPKNAYDFAVEETMHSARYPSRLSSATSNEMHKSLGAAWARMAEFLKKELSQ